LELDTAKCGFRFDSHLFGGGREGRTKAFQPAQHAPMTLVAFDVAAYVLIVCAVFRAHNLFFGGFEIEKVSH
jgi:hypothetical protein